MQDQNKDKKRPALVPFGDATIQESRRLAIPPVLLQNVDLQVGDPVKLYFDAGYITGQKAIVVIKSMNSSRTGAKGRRRQGQG